ncbi:MAG: ABC transporter permease [Clostridia bacterium]|nr:ABC transporter permease [Clostridia bacterium]
MFTLLKLSYKNIFEKKFRCFLIVLSVALSVALIYTILSLSTTITTFYESEQNKSIGNTDLVLSKSKDAINPVFEQFTTDAFKGFDLEYALPVLEGFGYYEKDEVLNPVRFTGMNLNDFNQIYRDDFSNQTISAFKNLVILIGENTSERLKLSSGDVWTLTIGNRPYDFTVYEVHDDYNLLASSTMMESVVIPYETANEIMGLKNHLTSYYISINSDDVSKVERELNEAFPGFDTTKAVSSDDLSQMLTIIQVSLSLMTLSVLIVSCFIIFSSFKIIILERMTFIGTLRSLGSTIKNARKVLLLESIFYGIIGGFFGILLGFGALKLTLTQLLSMSDLEHTKIALVHPGYAFIGLLMAIVLVLGSSFMPIRKISKTSVKELLFSEVRNSKHFSLVRSIFGLILIVFGFYLVKTKVVELQMLFSFIGMILTIVGSALIVPVLVMLLRKPLSLILAPGMGYHSKAASIQLVNDKTLMNNIILLAMGLGIILMINTFSLSVGELVIDIYGKCQSDIVLMYREFDDTYVNKVKDIESVTHVYPTRGLFDLTANDEVVLPILEGIDTAYAKYAWDEFGEIFTPEFNEQFINQRTIIITTLLATKYDLKEGQTLTIHFENKSADYQIIKIVPSIMNNGNMSFIDTNFFVEDSSVSTYQGMYVNTDKPDYVVREMKKISPFAMYPIETLDNMRTMNQEGNASLFNLMKAISVIAMLIGSIGIFNNYIISFFSRRKTTASLRSLGVNKGSMMKLFLSESLIGGLVGAFSGTFIGIILLEIMKLVLMNMNISSTLINYQISEIIFISIAALVLSLIGSMIPAYLNMKRPLVPELKYE